VVQKSTIKNGVTDIPEKATDTSVTAKPSTTGTIVPTGMELIEVNVTEFNTAQPRTTVPTATQATTIEPFAQNLTESATAQTPFF